MLKSLTTRLILTASWLITAARGIWLGCEPVDKQRIYFANHNSHGDFILIWSVLPRALRRRTRPVAGADYWLASGLRRYIIQTIFNAVLIDRSVSVRQVDPIQIMTQALSQGDSIILFPEGTRNTSDRRLLPFKSGLSHLAAACPEVALVPVWIYNIGRVMPKGALIPVPLLCSVTFGTALHMQPGESKKDFLQRAEAALLALAPSQP